MRVEGFVIHLVRAEQRRPQVERLKEALPMPVHLVEAVDGHALSESEIGAVHRRRLHWPPYPFALGKGEIGCFLSHRKAWREIVERDLDAGLIVEDDVEMDRSSLEGLLGFLDGVVRPTDFVRLPQKGRSESGPAIASQGPFAVVEPSTPAFGMVAQLVGREAARNLLELTEVFDRPVDAVIQMRWLHGLRILSARPIIAREISGSLGGSFAQSRRGSATAKLRREFLRPIYRLSVRIGNMVCRADAR